MNPWVETIIVVLLALAGAGLGYLCSRLRRPYWLVGYVPSLALGVTIALARRHGALAFKPPFSWVTMGHREFFLMGPAWAMALATLIPKLSTKRLKWLVGVFLAVAVMYFSVLPFLYTALVWKRLAGLRTIITVDGVCLQTTGFTCGPAAAVTALRRLGLDAQEGELAMLAHSNAMVGTDADTLCAAIHKRYGAEGVRCTYRHFESISELKGPGVPIVVIKYAPLIDHYVTVLEVTGDTVVVGDPLKTRMALPHARFEEIWRYCGIVVTRGTHRSLAR